jgi:hypothetical protein
MSPGRPGAAILFQGLLGLLACVRVEILKPWQAKLLFYQWMWLITTYSHPDCSVTELERDDLITLRDQSSDTGMSLKFSQ